MKKKGKMNLKTKLFVAGIAVTSLALAGCTQTPQQTQEQTQEQVQNEFAQVAQAIQAGKGAHCTITQQVENQQQKMEYWIKGNKMKASGLAQANDQDQTNQYSYMLSDGDYTYMWGDNGQGLKWKIESDDMSEDNQYEPEVPNFENAQEMQNYQNQGYQVNCEEQNLDDSFFTSPDNIQFQSMEMMMENAFGQIKQEMMQEQDNDPEMMIEDQTDNEMDADDATQQYQLMMQKYNVEQ